MSIMERALGCLALAPSRALLAACALSWFGTGCQPELSTVGTVVALESLDTRYGLSLGAPTGLVDGPDGSLYVLDQLGGTLLQLRPEGSVDTLARPGSGPGELKQPSALAWFGDSLLVVDAGNARVQVLDPTRPRRGGGRTLPFARGAAGIAVDRLRRMLYAVTYGQNFRLVNGRPVIGESTLVSVVSLEDGSDVFAFGTARRYPGTVVPILANIVSIARDARGGDVWLAWPLDPVLARFDEDGVERDVIELAVDFTPTPPREYRREGSPVSSAQFQQLLYDVAIDQYGRLMALLASHPGDGRPGSSDYRPPRQVVQIIDRSGDVACRFDLPVFASGFSISRRHRDELLLVDSFDQARLYRLRFQCPRAADS